MNSKDIDKALSNVWHYLDTIDLMPYLKKFENKELHNLIENLNKTFPYKDEWSEILFDAVGEDEFMDYLNEKYNLNIREQWTSNCYIRL